MNQAMNIVSGFCWGIISHARPWRIKMAREFDVNPEHNLCLEVGGVAQVVLTGENQSLPLIRVREVSPAYDDAVKGMVEALEILVSSEPTNKDGEFDLINQNSFWKAQKALAAWEKVK